MESSIPFTTTDNTTHQLKVITPETLAQICPEAFAAAETQLDDTDLSFIWIMTAKPQLVEPASEENYDREVWTETNEPELAAWIAEVWDQAAVNVNGQQVVILCGTNDDEYGNFWDNSQKRWNNYAF